MVHKSRQHVQNLRSVECTEMGTEESSWFVSRNNRLSLSAMMQLKTRT